jgi:hypothetical protein
MVDWRPFSLPRYFYLFISMSLRSAGLILVGFIGLDKTGMNGILMYLGHQGAYSLFPWHWEYGPMNTHFEKLVETLWGVSLWVLTATWLYHKKIFLAL